MEMDLSVGFGLLRLRSTMPPPATLPPATPPWRVHSSPRPSNSGAEARILTQMHGKSQVEMKRQNAHLLRAKEQELPTKVLNKVGKAPDIQAPDTRPIWGDKNL